MQPAVPLPEGSRRRRSSANASHEYRLLLVFLNGKRQQVRTGAAP